MTFEVALECTEMGGVSRGLWWFGAAELMEGARVDWEGEKVEF